MEKRHSDEATMSGVNQLFAPNEIKQEPDVKEEPMTIGDLVELPAIINNDIGQPLHSPYRYNGEDAVVNLPLNEVKIEVHLECGATKKKTESKANEKNGNALGNRPIHSLGHASASKSSAQGNVVKKHQCGQCGYRAKYKCLLEVHLIKHTGEKPFPCKHCPKEFTSKQGLQCHLKMHAEEFLFNCAACLEGFDEKDQKLEHEKECRLRRYECHLCKQSIGSLKKDLIRHIRIHSGAKPFQCKECSKQFAHKYHLKSHMKSHAGPRLFHCSRCRLGFVQQNEMVAHEQKCSRRVYECYVCGKFIGLIKGHLEYHMRTHTGEKPFQCKMCPSKFTWKSNLTRHMNRIHNLRR